MSNHQTAVLLAGAGIGFAGARLFGAAIAISVVLSVLRKSAKGQATDITKLKVEIWWPLLMATCLAGVLAFLLFAASQSGNAAVNVAMEATSDVFRYLMPGFSGIFRYENMLRGIGRGEAVSVVVVVYGISSFLVLGSFVVLAFVRRDAFIYSEPKFTRAISPWAVKAMFLFVLLCMAFVAVTGPDVSSNPLAGSWGKRMYDGGFDLLFPPLMLLGFALSLSISIVLTDRNSESGKSGSE